MDNYNTVKRFFTFCFLSIGVVALASCNEQQFKQNQPIVSDSHVEKQGNEAENLQTYTSKNFGISFQYPKHWYVKEDISENRIYIKNVQGDLDINKGNMPTNFQQLWISTWELEASKEAENNVKSGKPNGREFGGSLSASTIKRDGFVMNTYEYITTGGPTLEAFWSDKNRKKYYATHSTEVGQENQKSMVENLKLILSTVECTQ